MKGELEDGAAVGKEKGCRKTRFGSCGILFLYSDRRGAQMHDVMQNMMRTSQRECRGIPEVNVSKTGARRSKNAGGIPEFSRCGPDFH